MKKLLVLAAAVGAAVFFWKKSQEPEATPAPATPGSTPESPSASGGDDGDDSADASAEGNGSAEPESASSASDQS